VERGYHVSYYSYRVKARRSLVGCTGFEFAQLRLLGRGIGAESPNLDSASCVRIGMFLISPDGGTSRLEKAIHQWLQGPYGRAIMYQFGDCQPTLGVEVSYSRLEGFLLKHCAIRAHLIIHCVASAKLFNISVHKSYRTYHRWWYLGVSEKRIGELYGGLHNRARARLPAMRQELRKIGSWMVCGKFVFLSETMAGYRRAPVW
jgi:hypothetical protein